MSAAASFPSREELLGGLPARRASTLLFAIESRTAQLVARSRRVLLTQVTERGAADQERAFLAAMAAGRGRAAPVRIQDLDRYAPRWHDLVPDDPQLKAALARLVLEKYSVPRRARRLRTALGLDDPAVIAAYERAHRERPDALLARRSSVLERFRWLRSAFADRLERMPPFWIAFALTLTETVGGGILALPIALAGFGPLGAIAVLVAFGIFNVLTVAALCEAITRNGHMRYGTAYFGRLVSDYLGRPGLLALSVAFPALMAVVLLFVLIGFADVMNGVSGIHPAIWAAGLFLVTMLVLRRGSLDATIASAIAIGTVNLVVLALIALVAFLAGAAGTPAGRPVSGAGDGVTVDAITLGLAFGVVLASYFGHLSAGNVAKVVLARDPGGRSLLWGNVAAMTCVIAVYSVVVIAVFSALDERTLIGYPGTVIQPLADAAGPAISVLAAIYAPLGFGLGALYSALSLYNLAGEAFELLARRPGARGRALLESSTGRFVAQSMPAIAVFALVEVLLLTESSSFSGPLSVIGALTVPLLAGVFPVLMVAAARRRGDRVPQSWIGLVGRIPVVAALWLGAIVAIVVHVVIWQPPVDRLVALLVGAATFAVTVLVLRRGALRPRVSVEVRWEGDARTAPSVHVVSSGRPIPAATQSDVAGELVVDLPALNAGQMRLWAHRVTADDVSEGLELTARVEPLGGGEGRTVALGPDGEAVVQVAREPLRIVFTGLSQEAAPAARPAPVTGVLPT